MSIEAMKHYEAALLKAFPKGASGDVFEHWNKARQAIAEAEQNEPVGYWMGKFSKDGGATLYEVKQESMFGCAYQNIPLYTNPQPRKPLTDARINEIADTVANMPLVGIVNDFRTRFARAIEAAHGIKE